MPFDYKKIQGILYAAEKAYYRHGAANELSCRKRSGRLI